MVEAQEATEALGTFESVTTAAKRKACRVKNMNTMEAPMIQSRTSRRLKMKKEKKETMRLHRIRVKEQFNNEQVVTVALEVGKKEHQELFMSQLDLNPLSQRSDGTTKRLGLPSTALRLVLVEAGDALPPSASTVESQLVVENFEPLVYEEEVVDDVETEEVFYSSDGEILDLELMINPSDIPEIYNTLWKKRKRPVRINNFNHPTRPSPKKIQMMDRSRRTKSTGIQIQRVKPLVNPVPSQAVTEGSESLSLPQFSTIVMSDCLKLVPAGEITIEPVWSQEAKVVPPKPQIQIEPMPLMNVISNCNYNNNDISIEPIFKLRPKRDSESIDDIRKKLQLFQTDIEIVDS